MAIGLRIGDGRTSCRFTFDGRLVEARAGESIAAALLAAGIRTLRRAPVDGGPRGAFCMMGLCQECVVMIDGRRVESCRTPASDGLVVTAPG